MVKEIKIQNYKSVQDLTLELGRINVLIGANGCGKSNILEAIAFGSAATEDKLGNEFLSSRGIRVTEPKAMRSGFNKGTLVKNITISFKSDDNETLVELGNVDTPFSEWGRNFKSLSLSEALKFNQKAYEFNHKAKEAIQEIKELMKTIESVKNFDDYSQKKEKVDSLISNTNTFLGESENKINEFNQTIELFKSFLIYAPENTFLRKFEEESQIEPLGIRGEGLFKLLSVMSQETPEEFQEIIENLELIDWFDGFEIPKDLVFTERRIRIKDRFLEEGLQYFDQRSSNEGFLFLMFYFALFISKYTPKFFAIDNIDASLNPKLCIELIKILTKLAKKHDKQVIFTTHNPAILDGLNLNDDEVRLLVVSRNKEGHTKTKRITPTIVPKGEKPVRLSVQFMRGYIGGLPKNF
jgi:predicted ATPase